MENKTDLRIIKTKNILFASLLELLKEKSFEEIKVSDICTKALINRSTFYAHYNDKYDLLVDCFNSMRNDLIEKLEENKHYLNTKDYYMELIKIVLEYLKNERDLYYGIMIHNRNSIIINMIYDVVDKDIEKRIANEKLSNKNIPVEFITKFYLGAVTAIGMNYLMKKSFSEKDIINYFNILIPDEKDLS